MGALTTGQAIGIAVGFVALMCFGVLASWMIRELQASRATRREPARLVTNRRRQPVFAPEPSRAHRPALLAGALRAVAAGELVDGLAYRRTSVSASTAGVEADLEQLLGSGAREVAPALALLEASLAARLDAGPELWRHEVEGWAEQAGLPLADRRELVDLERRIVAAESTLTAAGLLAAGGRIPGVAVVHWAEGVHLARAARCGAALDDAALERWLGRADALIADAFGTSTRPVLAALLLPGEVWGDPAENAVLRGVAVRVAERFEQTAAR